jgi:hypothetical protein
MNEQIITPCFILSFDLGSGENEQQGGAPRRIYSLGSGPRQVGITVILLAQTRSCSPRYIAQHPRPYRRPSATYRMDGS